MGSQAREVVAEAFLSTPSARRATVILSLPTTSRKRFLSTPSARRATQRTGSGYHLMRYFYPRPPRGGRLTSKISVSCAS